MMEWKKASRWLQRRTRNHPAPCRVWLERDRDRRSHLGLPAIPDLPAQSLLPLFLSFLVLLSLLGIAACGKAGGAGAAEDGRGGTSASRVRVAFFPNMTHVQALVMRDRGSLERALGEGTEVEWLDFNAGPSEVEAMFAGEVDIGYIGPVPAVTAYIQSEGDVRMIAGAVDGGSALVTREGAGIRKVEDLAGKTVAVPKLGNTQHLLLLKVLEDHNLAPRANGGTVSVVPVANADVGGVMDMGQVDAALTPEPWGTTLDLDHGARELLDYRAIWMDGAYATTVVIVRKDFLSQNPGLVEKFLETHRETTEYVRENPEEAQEIVNRQLGELTGKSLSPEVLGRAFDRMIVTDEIPGDSIMEYARVNLKQGFIRELPGEDLIEAGPQQKAD